MNKTFLIIAVAIIVVVGGIFVLREGAPQNQQTVEPNTIIYSDSGYAPKEITVKRGETVTFTNKSSQLMWTASAIHPSHQVYPGTSIQKCSSVPAGEMFDSCAGIFAGESWAFQFNETGSWGYHNHLRPSHWGKVIVE